MLCKCMCPVIYILCAFLLLEPVLHAFLLVCPSLFPLKDINWKSKIEMMNSIFFQTSCGFLVDSPVELSGL